MFTKIIIFLILFQYNRGSPLESVEPQHNVKACVSSRIVGGQDAPDGYAKHMVALVIDDLDGSSLKFFTCGGSIISKKHVLTAAHCIDPYVVWGKLIPEFKGVVGSNYWNSTNYIHFSDYKLHPGWSWVNLKHDIGILITAIEIVFGKLVGAIALNFNFVDGKVWSFVTGWGRLGVNGDIPYCLQVLYLNTISSKLCKKAMRLGKPIWGFEVPVDPAFDICTIHFPGHGMCNGDSGSALVDAKSRKQMGIVSRGIACAHGWPDVFVRISPYRPFVEKVLGRHLVERQEEDLLS